MKNLSMAWVVPVAIMISGAAHAEIDACPAEKYRACDVLKVEVAITDYEPKIDNMSAGYTRATGKWKIHVFYRPETKCARVRVLLNAGPIDVPFLYKQDLRNGTGVIDGSGGFMHKRNELETALGKMGLSCRVPDDGLRDKLPKYVKWDSDHSTAEWDAKSLLRKHGFKETDARTKYTIQNAEDDPRYRSWRLGCRRWSENCDAKSWYYGHHARSEYKPTKTQRIIREMMDDIKDAARREEQEREAERARREVANMQAFFSFMKGLTGQSGDSFSSTGSGNACAMVGQRLADDLGRVLDRHSNSICGMARGQADAMSTALNQLRVAGCSPGSLEQSIRQAREVARASCSSRSAP